MQDSDIKNKPEQGSQVKSRMKRGLLTTLKNLLENSRIGDLLISQGLLTQEQLECALQMQRAQRAPIGRILLTQQLVRRRDLYRALTQQWTLRCMAAGVGLFISFSSFGGVKSARAGSVKDIPAQMQLAKTANEAFTPVAAYPALFGSAEKRSGNIDPFTKWTGMFSRFDTAMNQPAGQRVVDTWKKELGSLAGLPLEQMAARVNSMVNAEKYILDNANWGQSDYWSTPVEFFTRGGDCEDFAIAKYTALRALGVPEERLRIVIVHDEEKDIPHAILAVYTDTEALILDNQSKQVRDSDDVSHYRPIFSINRSAWWLHTGHKPIVVASR